MKIDRRSFLGLGLGAAAGVAVSPAVWKLTDDSSIWTQNWPWTPVPRDGEITFDNTVCTLCPGNCGISVKKVDGRAIKIEGTKGHPVNDGGVCLHGISGLQYIYDPSRVRFPMAKKEGKWKQVSWETAASLVAGKIKELRDKGASDSVACVTANDRGSIAGLFKRLLMAIGSQNIYSVDTIEKSYQAMISKMHGINASAAFDIANADFILSFGTAFIEGWGSPVSNFLANSARKERQSKLVQVESRLSNTAAAADRWIPAKPGTEADLALAICSAMISANLHNTEFAKKAGDSFDAFVKFVNTNYAPETVSKTTGIDASVIKEVAADFAKAKSPLAIAGRGKGGNPGSVMEFAAAHALNCLTGNINKEGGFWTVTREETLTWPSLEMDDIATKGYAKPPVGMISSDSAATSMLKMFEAINASEKSPIELLMVYNANPCFILRNSKAVKEAVDKIPFVVSFSPYLDDTAQLADVILPTHTNLEMAQDVYSGLGIAKSIISVSKPVAGPAYDTKTPGDAIIAVAKAAESSIGESFPWESYEECLQAIIGDQWDTLAEECYIASDFSEPADPLAVDFSILTGYQGLSIEGDEKTYPLTLIPVDEMRIASGACASSPFAVKTVEDTVLLKKDVLVEINPETAGRIGVKHGDYAVITTPVGETTVRINLFDGIMPGVVAMAEGLGHSSGISEEVSIRHDNKIKGASSMLGTTGGVTKSKSTFENRYIGGKGKNVNELIGPVTDPVSGLDVAWGIRARISRA